MLATQPIRSQTQLELLAGELDRDYRRAAQEAAAIDVTSAAGGLAAGIGAVAAALSRVHPVLTIVLGVTAFIAEGVGHQVKTKRAEHYLDKWRQQLLRLPPSEMAMFTVILVDHYPHLLAPLDEDRILPR